MIAHKPYKREPETVKATHVPTILICFAGFIITFLAYSTYKSFESQQRLQQIQSNNQKQLSRLKRQFSDDIHALDLLKTFYDSSTFIDREEFKQFAVTLLNFNPAIQALEWVPKILDNEREEYKQKAIKDGFENYEIVEPGPDGQMVVSGKREVYYPVYYVEPYKGNEIILGLDPPEHKSRIAAIKKATETGKTVATPSMILTQETKQQKGVLIFSPVYHNRAIPDSIEERHTKLKGFILMALRVGDTINHAMEISEISSGVTVTDITNPTNPDILFQSTAHATDKKFVVTEAIDIATRKWQISVYPQITNQSIFFNGHSWIILFVGTTFNFFITFIIFQLINRHKIIEDLVSKRTQEVQELSAAMERTVEGVSIINTSGKYEYINDAYANMCGYPALQLIGEHWHKIIVDKDIDLMECAYNTALNEGKSVAEPQIIRENNDFFNASITLIKKTDENEKIIGCYCFMSDITQRKATEVNLKQANEELEEFAYRTSHDLRSPLISSINLLQMTKESIKEDDPDDASECLDHAARSLDKLHTLVKDILTLSKAKTFEEEETFVNLNTMIDDCLSSMAHMSNFDRLEIKKKLQFKGSLKTKASRIQLIVENIISNAIKYQNQDEEQPFIEISTYIENNHFVFEVKDNGLGIAKEHHHKLFKMFQRFHTKISYGSGLGLYMMKKSADIISGELIYEPISTGSIFKLKIPLARENRDEIQKNTDY